MKAIKAIYFLIPILCLSGCRMADVRNPTFATASGGQANQEAIRQAGFTSQLRTQKYKDREIPAEIEQQVINY